MPRTNYLPDRHIPIGYTMAYQKAQYEDKPTIEVDLSDSEKGLQQSLIEAVCVALETWDPVFDHWADPPTRYDENGEEISSRKVPVFRGRHASKVLKFRDDIFRYMSMNPADEQQKNVYVKIASKYCHIRPTPRYRGQASLPHQDVTHYNRDVIRPVIRRSDPEWDRNLVLEARRVGFDRPWEAHLRVIMMLGNYDGNHDTAFAESYEAESDALADDRAPLWEHWRLVSHYVQDIADARYVSPTSGLSGHTKYTAI
jgi:hypothetical protein